MRVGYEVSGTIAELGEGVEGLQIGQRVFSGTTSAATKPGRRSGGRRSHAPGELLLRAGGRDPGQLRDGVGGPHRLWQPAPGERVLIHSAGGGVGIAATQLARSVGAEIYGTASPGKHARIAELGVEHPLDYTKPGWERGLPQFDVILDAVGGRSFRRSYSSCARAGGLSRSASRRS